MSGLHRTGVAVAERWRAELGRREDHVRCLVLQYQRRVETIWNAANISPANGGPAASALCAQFGGSHHNLLWDAGESPDAAAGEWCESMPNSARSDVDLYTSGEATGMQQQPAFGSAPSFAISRPPVNV